MLACGSSAYFAHVFNASVVMDMRHVPIRHMIPLHLGFS